MTTFAVAVGSTSLVCYLLMTRLQNRGPRRRSTYDNSTSDGGNDGAGWTIANGFGGHQSPLDSSGNPSDWGGGDSGGGGDGGGGAGGGGGD